MSSLDETLLIEEYKSCRELIKINIDIIEKSEVYVVGAAAASAAFCLTSTNSFIFHLSCWLPLLLSVIGTIRFLGLDYTIGLINNHLANIETRIASISWTTQYRIYNKYKLLKITRWSIWVTSIVLGFCFGGYMSFREPIAAPTATASHVSFAPSHDHANGPQLKNSN